MRRPTSLHVNRQWLFVLRGACSANATACCRRRTWVRGRESQASEACCVGERTMCGLMSTIHGILCGSAINCRARETRDGRSGMRCASMHPHLISKPVRATAWHAIDFAPPPSVRLLLDRADPGDGCADCDDVCVAAIRPGPDCQASGGP